MLGLDLRERLEHLRTRCLIRLSVATLEHLGLERSAESINLLYAYFDRGDRSLSTALDHTLAEHGTLTQEDCADLHGRFLALGTPTDPQVGGNSELGELARRLRELEGRHADAVADLARRLDRAEVFAATDGLTGLLNRRSFEDRAREVVEVAHTGVAPLCLLMLDVDHFKSLNDRFGHDVGDHVLRLIARGLMAYPGRTTLAARHGGEEFALLLPGVRLEDAVRIADTIRAALASRRLIMRGSGAPLGQVTVSIGVAELDTGEAAEHLLRRADKALYRAKSQGRNRVAIAPAEPGRAVPSRGG